MTQTESLPEPDPQYRTLYDILNRTDDSNTQYTNEYRRRTAFQVSKLIYDTATELRLPGSVRETAANYYVTASDSDIIKGASQEAMTGAVIRAATMEHNTPRPLGHLAEVVDESPKTVRTKLSQLFQHIDAEYSPVEPDDYIDFVSTELEIPAQHDSIQCAYDILTTQRDEDESFFYSKSPIAVAGGAMYAALRCEPVTGIHQREVADACNVSEVTIRNHYQPLLETYMH